MRILVTGSRDWPDETLVQSAIRDSVIEYWSADPPPEGSRYAEDVIIVHGACPTGADRMASDLAKQYFRSYTEEPHLADWRGRGKRAGPARNAEMVALGADVCLAFIKGESKGATMTADLARKAGIPVKEYRLP